MVGPQPMTRRERLALVEEMHSKLRARYGDQLKAIALYGSTARGTDGPYSDIELICVLRSDGEEYSFEWSAGPWKAEVDVYSEAILLAKAARVSGSWPMTHGAFQTATPLYDPDGYFQQVRDAASAPTDEQIRTAIEETLVGELYELAGKLRNATAACRTSFLPMLATYFALYGAWVIGLQNRRCFTASSIMLEEAMAWDHRPPGYDRLCRMVTAGRLSSPTEVTEACEDFWQGLNLWAREQGYQITDPRRIPF